VLRISKHLLRILLLVLLGGILGAALGRFSPGFGVDEQELDSRLSNQSIGRLREEQGRDRAFASFCFHHFTRLLHGDLGVSRSLQRPVSGLLQERFPETAKSVALSLVLGWTVGLCLASFVVISRNWGVDLLASLFTGVLMCLPAAVLALLFVIVRAPARLVLAVVIIPTVFRYSRNLLARSASQPHVTMAHAKGLGIFQVLFRHILLPAAPQLLALAGVSVTLALTAAIPVEALCDLPGIGQLAWKAALGRDLYLLVNLTMIVAVITVVANSVSDLLAGRFRTSAA
jgi:peptide/nickel transport system permease protein